MYTLLVVDDEKWIRQRLAETIDWNSIGIDQVHRAADGESALAMVREHAPDVIITDIRMPELSGLDFIERLKQEEASSMVIFISGYNDFEYAQRALKLGAYDYLLKPVDNAEILNVVKKCMDAIKNEKRKENVLAGLKEKLEKNKSVLKEHFLLDILNGYIDEETVENDLDYFDIDTQDCRHLCLTIQQDKELAHGQEAHLVQLGIKDLAQEFLSLMGKCQVIIMQMGESACVVSSALCEEDLLGKAEEAANKIKEVITQLFGRTVTIGVGGVCENILELPHSLGQARQAALYRSYLGGNSVYKLDSIQLNLVHEKKYDWDIDAWLRVLKAGDDKTIGQEIDGLFGTLNLEQSKPLELKSIYMGLLISIIHTSYEFAGLYQEMPAFNLELFTRLNKIDGIEACRTALMQMMKNLAGYLKKPEVNNTRKIVQLVIRYIEDHYNESITLSDAANVVYLNPTYLCKLFKSGTGMTFTKYIMHHRIAKAVEFMADPKLKIYEIAEMAGYSDVQYFTKIFKAVKGMSPTQYRDKIV